MTEAALMKNPLTEAKVVLPLEAKYNQAETDKIDLSKWEIKVSNTKGKIVKDLVLPLRHTLLVKYLEEASDGSISVVGTVVQKILKFAPKKVADDGEEVSYFSYRFNDQSVSENAEAFTKRAVRSLNPDNDVSMTVMTASVKIPLDLKTIFFKVSSSIFIIEYLSPFTFFI